MNALAVRPNALQRKLPLMLALVACTSASAELPSYATFELQARTNLLINDNGFNLPPGASFNSVTVDLNDSAALVFRVQVVPGFQGMSVWSGAAGNGSLVCDSANDSEAIISDPKLNQVGAVVFSQFFAAANNSPDEMKCNRGADLLVSTSAPDCAASQLHPGYSLQD